MKKLLHGMVVVGALLPAVCGTSGLAKADHAMTPQAVFSILRKSWIGTWSCTKSATNTKPVQWTETVTPFGDKWLKTVGVDPATKTMSSRAFESVLGYDSERRQWVTVSFLSDGTYGIDRGTSGQNAMTQIWVNAYPVYSTVAATQVMTKRGYTVDGTYKEDGKRVSFHWNCVKN